MTQLQRLVIVPNQFEHQLITLTTSQQHYLRRVLRLQEGDRFIAVDGAGHWFLSELSSSSEQATVIEELDGCTELPVTVTLIIAMPKQGMDDIVRHCTELGVTTIQPVMSDRTVLKPSPQKVERWQRIAEESAEQSERRFVPQVLSPCTFHHCLSQLAIASSLQDRVVADVNNKQDVEQDVEQEQAEYLRAGYLRAGYMRAGYICVARHDAPHLLHVLSQQSKTRFITTLSTHVQTPDAQTEGQLVTLNSPAEWMVAVGPEGGWTPEEIDRAIAHGYQPVSLGQRILRAVTAPTVALSLISSILEQDIK